MEATLTSGSPTSSTVNADNGTAIIIVEGTFIGSVMLQVQAPNGSAWVDVFITRSQTAAPILTPDPNVEYRVHSDLQSGSVDIYLGVTS